MCSFGLKTIGEKRITGNNCFLFLIIISLTRLRGAKGLGFRSTFGMLGGLVLPCIIRCPSGCVYPLNPAILSFIAMAITWPDK